MTADRPTIAITAGDPSGIGPEIVAKAIRDPRVVLACHPAIYGPHTPDELRGFPACRVDAASGRAAYDAIVAGVAAVRDRRAAALVTAPINKEAFAAAGL